MSKVETLLFGYDFTDLYAAATVVEDIQMRLRYAMDQKYSLENQIEEGDEQGHLEVLQNPPSVRGVEPHLRRYSACAAEAG